MRLRISPDDGGMNLGIERSRSEVCLMNEPLAYRRIADWNAADSGTIDGAVAKTHPAVAGGGFVGVTDERSETDDLAEYIL